MINIEYLESIIYKSQFEVSFHESSSDKSLSP